jgi:hypothetical protein
LASGGQEEGGGYEAGVAETLDDFGWEGLGGCSQGGGGGSGEATRRHVRCRRGLVMDVDKVRGDSRNGSWAFLVSELLNGVACLLKSQPDGNIPQYAGTKSLQIYSDD